MKFKDMVFAALTLVVAPHSFGAEDLSQIVVSQDGAAVHLGTIEARMQEVPPEKRAQFIDDGERLEKVLRDLMLVDQLAGIAKDRQMHKGELADYEIQLAINRMLATKLLNQLRLEFVPSNLEEMAEESYLASPEKYRIAEHRNVRHILIRVNDLRSKTEAKSEIEALQADLIADPTKFAELAAKRSEDKTSGANGGKLDPIKRGDTLPEFESAAFSLKNPNELSPIVETEHGYHLILLDSISPESMQPFEQVKRGIVEELRVSVVEEKIARFNQKLSGKEIKINEELLPALRTRYGDLQSAREKVLKNP